jgi:hypothetical protein
MLVEISNAFGEQLPAPESQGQDVLDDFALLDKPQSDHVTERHTQAVLVRQVQPGGALLDKHDPEKVSTSFSRVNHTIEAKMKTIFLFLCRECFYLFYFIISINIFSQILYYEILFFSK